MIMPKLGMEPIRRQALVEATIAEIGAVGTLDVTVAQIARRAGMSSALAHHYFGGKEQIFLAAMRHVMSVYAAEVKPGDTVVVVGVAVVLRVLVLDKVAPGLQVTVGVTVPAQPAIGTAMVCPPVNIAIPPLTEVPVSPPQRMLYPATLEFEGPWVSKLNV